MVISASSVGKKLSGGLQKSLPFFLQKRMEGVPPPTNTEDTFLFSFSSPGSNFPDQRLGIRFLCPFLPCKGKKITVPAFLLAERDMNVQLNVCSFIIFDSRTADSLWNPENIPVLSAAHGCFPVHTY